MAVFLFMRNIIIAKIVKKSKTYGDVKSDATNESIYNTYKLIKNMQEPIGESCTKTIAEELMDVA